MKSSTTNKLISGLSIAVIALVLSIGVSYVIAAGTFTEPTCGPTAPGCNVDAPLNVGSSEQEKLGKLELKRSLKINTILSGPETYGLDVFGISRFFGNVEIGSTTSGGNRTIKIVDGNQGAGKVLTSDANGLASWAPVGNGPIKAWFTWSRPNENSAGSILSSYNVSSIIADAAVTKKPPVVTLTSPMATSNYVVICNSDTNDLNNYAATYATNKTVNSFKVQGAYGADPDPINKLDCIVLGN